MDAETLRELFAALGPIRTRKMFGGQGVYCGDRIFAIEVGGELFLKVGESSIAAFRAAGSRPFTYEKNGKPVSMSYWLMPEAALDDPDEAARWGRLALDASSAKPRRTTRAAGGD